MKKSLLLVVLIPFITRLHAQFLDTSSSVSYTIDSLEQVVLAQPNDRSKDLIFAPYFQKYAFYKPDSALFYAQRELLLAKRLNSPLLEGVALTRYGYVLGLLGNYPQGIQYLLRGKQIGERLKDSFAMGYSYDGLSEVYTEQGDFKQALFYTIRSRDVAFRGPDVLWNWFQSMTMLYTRFNRLDSALFFGKQALQEELRVYGKIHGDIVPMRLGEVYLKRKDYAAALRQYRQALPFAIRESLSKDLIQIYNGMAEAFLKSGQRDSGSYYAHQALGFRSANAHPLGTLSTYHILYDLYREQGNADSAIQYLEQTVALKDTLFNQQKEREVQTLAFNEQLQQQEALAQQTLYRNRLRLSAVLGISFTLLVVALLLWRNIRHRQKAYTLLNEQKIKTDQALEDLVAAQAQLVQKEKMASLGELTAGIAHEIQNPLNFVNNFSAVNKELLQEIKEEIERGNLDEVKVIARDLEANEEKIIHHGQRAESIVKGMLQHARASSGEKKPTHINKLVDEYLRLSFQGMRAKDKDFNASIETTFDANTGTADIVSQDIGRVLLNLFNNAFYAVTKKKERLNGAFEPIITVSTKRKDNEIEITVKDNGTGMSPRIVEKIFQPFFTTKPAGEGTGLGLSLSYDIVTKGHGGTLSVQSTEDVGSEFVVRLPLSL